ncbi:MAG: tetratricopeptide repeat protein, partial [Bryobacteraceae bacterium]
MKIWLPVLAVSAIALLLLGAAPPEPGIEDRLARHRNLGKAFYENPTTQNEAVEEFAKALKLAPDSPRERLNYGLALLRAGKTNEGVAELLKVQKARPELPHTWFNLGIVYKKQGEHDKAVEQFERMVKLVPSEPISHYNLGALYKLVGRQDEAIREFETAAKLDPNLAAARFQLFNSYRTSGRPAEAKRELEIFQRLKKQQEGAAIPEDVDWNAYAEVYDIMEDRPPSNLPLEAKFQTRGLGAASGAAVMEANGDGRPDLLVWSPAGLRLEPGGSILDLKGIRKAVPGDFNNDGLMDVAVLTANTVELYVNRKEKFEKLDAALPPGRFETAVWFDYDHDYDLDLILLGSKPYLLRNQGDAGFHDRTADFPFVEGEALDAAWFRLVADTKGMDLLVSYKEREGVLYRD